MPKRPRNLNRELPWGSGTVYERHGKFVAQYLDGAGNRKQATFADRDEANEFVRAKARQRRSGHYISDDDITVRDLIEQWLERGHGEWSSNTYATYCLRTSKHVLPSLGVLSARNLHRTRVQHWLDGLRKQGLAPSTIDAAYRVLSSALHEAVSLGIIASNPCAGTKRPAIRRESKAVWSKEESERVLASLEGEAMWYALYLLALTTGMRPGELRALQWRDIDLDKRTLMIARTMTRDDHNRVVVGNRTKTGVKRTVALSATVAMSLQRWRSEQKVRAVEGFVFTRADGLWLPYTNWQRRHEQIIAQAAVAQITIHSLRHTFATQMMQQGIHPSKVSAMLGHKDIAVTLNTYTHTDVEDQRSIADLFDEWFSGNLRSHLRSPYQKS